MTTERTPSKTAMFIAAYRARASARPNAICHDPWAAQLAGEEGMDLARRQDKHYEHLELWTAVRTAYLDQHVVYWTGERGFDQVVLLGAGLDCRAARLARHNVRYFEVDHPGSQAYKRRRVKELTGYPQDAATYVACDFEKDDFRQALREARFDVNKPAFVLWEGVTPYLPEEAVRTTLAWAAEFFHPQSVLMFDLLHRAETRVVRDDDSRAFVSSLGEPVRFGTTDVLPMLYATGFKHVRSVSWDEACLSLTGTYERERTFRFQRMVLCSRTPSFHPM